jgi:aryl-phospho-beta-D-glucosidase BglC (GH1 family)
VRISIHPHVWKNATLYSPDGKAGVLELLARDIDAAVAAGMDVVLDWHVIGWPDGYMQPVDPAWGAPEDLYDSDFALARDFWRMASRRFGRNGAVIFELWNEPVKTGNESVADRTQWAELKPFWETLTADIRAHGNNLILATSGHWAYNMRTVKDNLLADPNTAYAWHAYAGSESNRPDLWAASLDGLHDVRPVVVTEWGFYPGVNAHYRGSASSFGSKFVRFLDERRLSSTAWCWHGSYMPRMLSRNWRTPTVYGTFVKKYLAHP